MIRFFRLSSPITACATNQPEKSSLHNNYSIFYSARFGKIRQKKKKKLQAHFSVGPEARILSTHSSRRHYCLIPQVLFIQNRKLTKLKVIQMVRIAIWHEDYFNQRSVGVLGTLQNIKKDLSNWAKSSGSCTKKSTVH